MDNVSKKNDMCIKEKAALTSSSQSQDRKNKVVSSAKIIHVDQLVNVD